MNGEGTFPCGCRWQVDAGERVTVDVQCDEHCQQFAAPADAYSIARPPALPTATPAFRSLTLAPSVKAVLTSNLT